MAASRSAGAVYAGAVLALAWCGGALGHCQTGERSATAAKSAPAAKACGAASGGSPAAGVNLSDADSLLQTAVPRTIRNRRQAMAYTYQIDYRNRNFSSKGKLLADYKAKYDVIFVEGLPYRRQIEEDRRPLSSLRAAEEQRRYDQAFAERREMSLDQKRDYLRKPWNVDVPLPQLTSLFTNRIVGQEAVDGRVAIVVESRPRDDIQPADEEGRRALHKQVKLWIDRDDLIVSRIEATLVADDAAMKKGTVAKIDFQRQDGIWLPVRSDVVFQAMDGAEIVRGETTEANAGFQRFRVDVRLMEPTETAGGAGQAQ